MIGPGSDKKRVEKKCHVAAQTWSPKWFGKSKAAFYHPTFGRQKLFQCSNTDLNQRFHNDNETLVVLHSFYYLIPKIFGLYEMFKAIT